MKMQLDKYLKRSIIIFKFAIISMNHLQREKQKTTTTTSILIIAIVAALGLVGVVAITIVTIPQQAEAVGCRNPIAFSKTRELCFDIPNGSHPPDFVHP
jgi:hypothetical protein